jgi:hypothetical protein
MPTWAWIVIAVAAVVAVGLIAWQAAARRRTARLRDRFGDEYQRTVESHGDRRAAESELADRVERRERLDIRPLSGASRNRYAAGWRQVQAQFVDDPRAALLAADSLVTSVMTERGYPMDDFEQRSADVSVDHPDVVENYRRAHELSRGGERGRGSTEERRRAMKHYRALFDELLEPEARQADGNSNQLSEVS